MFTKGPLLLSLAEDGTDQNDPDVRRILYMHSASQVGCGIGTPATTKSQNDRFKRVIHFEILFPESL